MDLLEFRTRSSHGLPAERGRRIYIEDALRAEYRRPLPFGTLEKNFQQNLQASKAKHAELVSVVLY